MKKFLFFASLFMATSASAQELRPLSEEIIVTARKYEETIQSSPVSITVLDEETLDARNANRTSDIPGIGQKNIIMSGDALLLSMRGQTQNIVDITTDSSVATYVDGIYMARGYGLNTTLLDVNNVQVLYGPQGTLFGRNSTGGAILFTTNNPTSDFSIGGEAFYNKDNEPLFNLVTNIPLSDDLAIRFAGLYEEENPSIVDRITGDEYEDKNTVHGRVKLRYSPNQLDMILAGEYYRSRGNNAARFMDYGFGQNSALAIMDPGDTVALDAGSFNRTEIYSVSTDINYDNLNVVAGYRRVQSNHAGDWDGTPLDLYSQIINADVEQVNVEANYTSYVGPFTTNIGLFYFQENGSELGEARFYGGFQHSRFIADIDNESYGVYLANYMNLTNDLRLNGSIRYTHDKKSAVTRNAALFGGNPVMCLNGGSLAESCAAAQSQSFDKVTWSVGLDYFLNPQTMLYTKVGTGYKSGGNQNRSLTNENVAFNPENIIEYEVGLKGTTGPLTYSVAGFYNEVDNYQILTVFREPIVHTLIVNAAETENYGAEINAQFSLNDNFIIHSSAQYVHPKFTEYERNGVDLTGNRFNNVTRYQFTVDGTYTYNNYAASVSYTWRDATAQASQSAEYLSTVYGAAEAEKILAVTTIPAHGILNAQLTAEFGNLTLRVFGENLTNTRYRESNSFNEGLWNTSTWNDDRTYGVSVGCRF